MTTNICLNCKQNYIVPNYMANKRKYCSIICAYQSPDRTKSFSLLTPELKQYLIDHYSSEKLSEISKILNIPKTSICRIAKKLNLTHPFGKGKPTSELGRKNMSTAQIKRFLSMSPAEKHQLSINMSNIIKKNGHPRGMYGKKHSPVACLKMSKARKGIPRPKGAAQKGLVTRLKHFGRFGNLNSVKMYSRTTKGWRTFANGKKYFMRSSWEMNYGCYLDWLKKQGSIVDWDYEVETFWFEKIKRGVRSYTPDFKVLYPDKSIIYHEVKGWMDAKSKTKLKRMKIYHPTINMLIIGAKEYKELQKNAELYGMTELKR